MDVIASYKPRVVMFGSRNAINDPEVRAHTEILARHIARSNLVLVNGGSKDGVMGYSAQIAHAEGGEVYGVGLHRYEPTIHPYLTNYEGYMSHWERQRRLIELGDVFIAVKGGFGTLHEIIDVYLIQGLGETDSPLIMVGDYMHKFETLVEYFEQHGMGRHKLLENNIHYVRTSEEALPIIDAHVKKYKDQNRYGTDFYPAMKPEEIYDHIRINGQPYYILFCGVKMVVHPDVYPSNRFRSSRLLAEYVQTRAQGKKILDMGCASGAIGLVAAHNGAAHVVHVDINSKAVRNVQANIREMGLENTCTVYQGSGFKPIAYQYRNYFDVIFFNPPFHSEVDSSSEKTELMNAFFTQGLEGGILDTFFRDAKNYLSPEGKLFIAFSNKDPRAVEYLEEVMVRYGYQFDLHILRPSASADVRVYEVKPLQEAPVRIRDQTIRVGVLLAETGKAKADGQSMKYAIQLAEEELTLRGNRFEIGFINDESSVSGAVAGAVKIIETMKPDFIIGPTWSELIDATAHLYESNSLPFYIPATSLDLLEKSDLSMAVGGAPDTHPKIETLALWARENNIRHVQCLTRDVKWGAVHQHMVDEAMSMISGTAGFTNVPAQDAPAALMAALDRLAGQPGVAIMADNYDDYFYDFIAAATKKGLHTPVICTLNMTPEMIASFKAVRPSMALYEFTNPVPPAFAEKFANRFDQPASRYAFNAYIGFMAMVDAFQENPDNIRQALIDTYSKEIYGERIRYSREGQIDGVPWQIRRLVI